MKVISHNEDIDFWKLDDFINSHSFRRMKTKFQLFFYDRFVLILTPVEKTLLDVIYTDLDIFVAVWEAENCLPITNSERGRGSDDRREITGVIVTRNARSTIPIESITKGEWRTMSEKNTFSRASLKDVRAIGMLNDICRNPKEDHGRTEVHIHSKDELCRESNFVNDDLTTTSGMCADLSTDTDQDLGGMRSFDDVSTKTGSEFNTSCVIDTKSGVEADWRRDGVDEARNEDFSMTLALSLRTDKTNFGHVKKDSKHDQEPSTGLLSKTKHRTKVRQNLIVAAILLAIANFPNPVVSRAENELFTKALGHWVISQFKLLPFRMFERFAMMEELIVQYDRLSQVTLRKHSKRSRENVMEAVQVVTGTAAENTATIGIETTATSLGHAAAGVVLAVFVDIAVTASILARAKVRKDRGKITVRQYKREVRDRIFQTGCQFVAGTTGTIVGQMVVPVPVVGAAIGGFVGSLVGLGVSKGVTKIQRVVERIKRRKVLMMIKNEHTSNT